MLYSCCSLLTAYRLPLAAAVVVSGRNVFFLFSFSLFRSCAPVHSPPPPPPTPLPRRLSRTPRHARGHDLCCDRQRRTRAVADGAYPPVAVRGSDFPSSSCSRAQTYLCARVCFACTSVYILL